MIHQQQTGLMQFLNRNRRARVAWIGCLAAALLVPAPVLEACPFCTAVSQTLRQEMAAMDAVVIAEATKDSVRNEETGEVPLRVVSVLKGKDFVKVGSMVSSVYYGAVEPGRRFMLSGVEPKQLLWSSPLPVDAIAEDYLTKVISLPPDDELARLRFFQEYLQHEATMLARDAYDEFASAPYDSIIKLRDEMDHDQLVEWIKDPKMPPDRRRLYLVMLGVCGDANDVPMLEQMLRSTRKEARTGLDSLVACYLTLAGAPGLETVNDLFLANKQANYADTYASIMAIRFHGTETDVIPRAQLVKSLHHVLDRPDLADLVIPDLARWSDWSQIDRLVKLFEEADPNDNWVRVPVVNYMRACPLPAAKKAMEKLKEIDPDAVKRANTFFSAPVPPDDKPQSDSSSMNLPGLLPGWVDESNSVNRIAKHEALDALPPKVLPQNVELADAAWYPSETASLASPVAAVNPNPIRLLGVVATAAATLMITAFLILSGGPHPQAQPIRVQARR